jgi:hypothetical protein
MNPDERDALFAGMLASNIKLATCPYPPLSDPLVTADILECEAGLIQSYLTNLATVGGDPVSPRLAEYTEFLRVIAQHPAGAALKILANQVVAAVLRASAGEVT